jgi:hypothetical protein
VEEPLQSRHFNSSETNLGEQFGEQQYQNKIYYIKVLRYEPVSCKTPVINMDEKTF